MEGENWVYSVIGNGTADFSRTLWQSLKTSVDQKKKMTTINLHHQRGTAPKINGQYRAVFLLPITLL
jgi:hypothetical protein